MNKADSKEYRVDGVAPVDVVAPSSEEELCEVVAAANKDGLGIIPYGGGTRIGLGNPPSRPCLVVDMANLNRVVSHNYADLTASFQAGATFGFVSEILAQQGQLLPIDPPLPERATMGGTLAAAVSGPLKWHFGHPRDTVIGMKVVQPDGSVTKSGGLVVKNVSGYDMSRLHIGGLGSLGIILEASFKLTPIPMYERTILAAFSNIDDAMDASMQVFNSYVMPLAMTAFGPAVASRVNSDEDSNRHHLAIRLGGRSRTLARQADEINSIFSDVSASTQQDIEGSASSLWRSLSDFGWTSETVPALNIKTTALPSHTRAIMKLIESLCDSDLEPAVVAEPGFGSVEACWYAPGDVSDGSLIAIVSKVRKHVARLGGTAVVQQCPPSVKAALDIWGEDHPGIDVMRRMKRQYDPNGIMNPGRFIGRI